MFCPECGSQIDDGIAFCTTCGARVDQGASVANANPNASSSYAPQPASSVSYGQTASGQNGYTGYNATNLVQTANQNVAYGGYAPNKSSNNKTPIIIAVIVGAVVVLLVVLVFALSGSFSGSQDESVSSSSYSNNSSSGSSSSSSDSSSSQSSSGSSTNANGYSNTEYVTGDDNVPGLSIQNVQVERSGTDYNVDATIYNTSSKYAYKDVVVEIILMDSSGRALAKGTTSVQVSASGGIIKPSSGSGIVKAALAYSGTVAKANIKVISATKMYN